MGFREVSLRTSIEDIVREMDEFGISSDSMATDRLLRLARNLKRIKNDPISRRAGKKILESMRLCEGRVAMRVALMAAGRLSAKLRMGLL